MFDESSKTGRLFSAALPVTPAPNRLLVIPSDQRPRNVAGGPA